MGKTDRAKNRAARMKKRPQTDRRDIRIRKQEMKASGDYSRKEIKIAKLTRKAENLHAENVKLGKLGTAEGIQSMKMGGVEYHNLVGRIRRLDPTGETSGYNMGPVGIKETHSDDNFSIANTAHMSAATGFDPLAPVYSSANTVEESTDSNTSNVSYGQKLRGAW